MCGVIGYVNSFIEKEHHDHVF